jgi:hypothetical protein
MIARVLLDGDWCRRVVCGRDTFHHSRRDGTLDRVRIWGSTHWRTKSRSDTVSYRRW